ncbi:unnamed protein product [Cuscuta europaea]|uniref:Single-stranded DNA binding protein Ssb-like OB fold domain-containing protein n=1 Tax=Cuscuta europaea TaxID=41803 RepID=A0A9P0YY51_CUSEU|nr:unnamed protein product [Cuscuta europaea]
MATAAAGSGEKRKPVFVKVDSLKPGTNGHTLTVKVISSTAIKSSGGGGGRRGSGGRASMSLIARSAPPARIAECLVGDETGTIIFTARNDQGGYVYSHVSCDIIVHLQLYD